MDTANALPPEDLLQYHLDFRVLVCAQCHYAIQPSGIARHLKEIHHVYRSRRRPYMQYSSQFVLAQPEEVIQSPIHEFPVRFLPVLDGLQCLHTEGCDYLCVSTERMQAHWLSTHKMRGDASSQHWRSAPLQTFFRGNLLTYFTSPTFGRRKREIPKDIVSVNLIESHGQMEDNNEELLHHYITFTSLTLVDRHGTLGIWQQTIPELAREHPFLMHALLTCSALHLAYKLPSRRHFYLLCAYSHQDVAMLLFRRAVAHVTKSNCHAILACCHLLVIYSFATDQPDKPLLLADTSSLYPGLLCDWLYFIRNGCHLVCEYWNHIETGPLAPLASSWESPILGIDKVQNKSRIMERLLSPLLQACQGSEDEVWPSNICDVYRDAATQLGEAFAASQVLSSDNFTTWDAIRVWPMHVSTAYMKLLAHGHPAALILLAYYCLLLRRLEPHWYFEGKAAKLLGNILSRLEYKWHSYVQNFPGTLQY